jgi:hypothetical protein
MGVRQPLHPPLRQRDGRTRWGWQVVARDRGGSRDDEWSRPSLASQPNGTYRVWLWNGEDPLGRAQAPRHGGREALQLGQSDFEGRLFVNSGRTTEIILAVKARRG